MILKLILEALFYPLLYTAFLLVIFKIQGPKKQLYNYPLAIQKRALEKGITTQKEMNLCAVKNKLSGLLVMIALCLLIICGINRSFSFWDGFFQSWIFLNTFSFFDALVLDTFWFCRSRWWIIPGTEDMQEEYSDIRFHWKWFFLGLVTTIPVAAITGALCVFAGSLPAA